MLSIDMIPSNTLNTHIFSDVICYIMRSPVLPFPIENNKYRKVILSIYTKASHIYIYIFIFVKYISRVTNLF